MSDMEFANRIRQLRAQREMTLEQVATIVGVGKSTVRKWETGQIANMRRDKIAALAHALGVDPEYLMGWSETPTASVTLPSPIITENYVTFPVLGDIAAGYDSIAVENWEGDVIEIPQSQLKGRDQSEFFVLRVKGDSMYPTYHDGDKVLILKQSTLNYSGQVGAILYDGELATLKKVEYAEGEGWLRLVPINPTYPTRRIADSDLERCRVIGIPRMLVREIEE